MPSTTQFVIRMQSKPGVLAKVASVLAQAGVNIKAFSAPETTGTGSLRVIVDDVERARRAFGQAKVRFREETALILSLENTPGALSQVAQHLTEAKLNVKCGYCTPSREGRRAIVVLTLSNTQKALDTLRGQALDEW
ncbi:MAG: ACT domain-containing protein [Nitrospirales bacterium]